MKMKNNKSDQILMLVIMATLLIVAPLIPCSLRPKYLYFIFNLLIIALAAEAGLLPTLSNKNNNNIKQPTSAVSPAAKPLQDATKKVEIFPSGEVISSSSTEKVTKNKRLCSDTPSLFFIGDDGEEDHYVKDDDGIDHELAEGEDDDDDDVSVGEINDEELFTKAETFIGNFYNQLKMQRDMGFMANDSIQYRHSMAMA